MKGVRFIASRLLLAWLLFLSGCGLFRNASKHRESGRTEHRRSAKRLLDSAAYLTSSTADFSVSVAHGVTETGIGFIAEGNALIRPDGTVSADKVSGALNQNAVMASAEADQSHKQRRAVQTVSESDESRESISNEIKSADKKTNPNRMLFTVIFVIATITWFILWLRKRI